jgi:hypothetical protein
LTAEVVARFTPLADNERFAFTFEMIRPTIIGISSIPPIWAVWELTLYAVRNNDIEDRRELITWEDVGDTAGVQFTSDLRTVFFTVRQRVPPTPFQLLYMVNGSTGEVKKMPIEVRLPWRASKDGRFVAFLKEGGGRSQEANISVFEVETGAITHLVWKANMRLEDGWALFMDENIFLIRGGFEKGRVATLAELDPVTMKLRTLMDITDWNNRIEQST